MTIDTETKKLEVARLAALSQIEYNDEWKASAKALGWSKGELDKAVAEAKKLSKPRGRASFNHAPIDVKALARKAIADVDDDATSSLGPEFSEARLSDDFAIKHSGRLRFIAEHSRWLQWDGQKWCDDRILQIWNTIKMDVVEASALLEKPSDQRALCSAKVISAVERLARSAPPLPATVGQFDADSWILNTPGGIIDLRAGKLLSSDPSSYCSKITSVGAAKGDPEAWLAFIDQITLGDKDLAAYLQRVAGYCMTGDTREHALFFLYGTGGNGKGVFVRALFKILNDYAVNSPIDTFTEAPGNHQNHPTELARLRGARLVTTSETEEGRRWAEARIKELTGGDPISARFMRQDFFQFIPQFKLVISGNNKPGLKGVDDSIRRRMNLVPFNLKLDDEHRDHDLDTKLQAEWPMILRWCVIGTQMYLESGLAPPSVVADATVEYLDGEDGIALWLDECCTLDRNLSAKNNDVFASWEAWAKARGEFVGTMTKLAKSLEKRGLERTKSNGIRYTRGLSVKPAENAGGNWH